MADVRADELPRPAGLGSAGRDLWDRLTAPPGEGEVTVFSPTERVTLELACRQADDLTALEEQLATEGLVVTGSRGQLRLSGLPTEIRLQRAALARLVAQLALPDDDEEVGLTPAQRHAQRAGQARWRNERDRRRQAAEAGAG